MKFNRFSLVALALFLVILVGLALSIRVYYSRQDEKKCYLCHVKDVKMQVRMLNKAQHDDHPPDSSKIDVKACGLCHFKINEVDTLLVSEAMRDKAHPDLNKLAKAWGIREWNVNNCLVCHSSSQSYLAFKRIIHKAHLEVDEYHPVVKWEKRIKKLTRWIN